MRWKQFFTPVQSMDAKKARQFIEEKPHGSLTILDVRQPAEYQAGHIAGAKLIPLPEIKDRRDEIDTDKPVIVYCAVGGRSRIASQMLSGGDFREVYNLSGGYKAWQGQSALGPEDQGLELFSGRESVEDVLIVAYSLEKGLRDFYLSMAPEMKNDKAKELFEKLAAIELNHQDRIFSQYLDSTGKTPDRKEFDDSIVVTAMEGGLTTEEYMRLYDFDPASARDVVGLAMAIEAQALDLYHRAAENHPDANSSRALAAIAREEQTHLNQLGELFDRL
jgi:sulfur-carrier protein adenylyltransferase/sulfurtransferase